MSSIPGELPRYQNVDGIVFKRLFAQGCKPVFLHGQNIAANLQILPGTVLGRITASGYLTPCVKTATDGSQTPYAVASRYIDTTANGPAGVSAVQPAAVVAHASFYIDAIAEVLDTSWGATPDLAWVAIEPLLRAVGIYGVPNFSSY
jgi:hypothetical protein